MRYYSFLKYSTKGIIMHLFCSTVCSLKSVAWTELTSVSEVGRWEKGGGWAGLSIDFGGGSLRHFLGAGCTGVFHL